MSVTVNTDAFVYAAATSISLSQMFTVTAGSTDPTYLVLTVLDRNEYTAGATGATGTLTGTVSGVVHTLGLSSISGDERGTGVVFTYTSAGYYNSTYGYLDQLSFNSSSSLDDVTNLSLFGTSNLSLATDLATNPYSMAADDAAGYIGSATVVTEPSFTGSVPAQATPDSIAAVANSFVGDAWNMNGCWVLTSTIAAEAGASLPLQSTLIGISGKPNGEWIVAFNGPAGQTGNWQSMVTAGEMVLFGTPGGGGHITTCVSGSGSTAMLVDNIVYVNASDQVLNPANDGSANDVLISAPHPASQEWAGVAASSVVIYELDTPIVTDSVSSDTLTSGASQSLASLFSATDPANKAITEWQVYDTATSDTLVTGGSSYSDHSAAAALTTTSLGLVSLDAGTTATTDTLEVRAFNGSYWGDWQSLNVAISAAGAASPPVLQTQTPNQTWTEGQAISLSLAATFKDPQNETLSYAVVQSNTTLLPNWLSFNATTDTLSGTAPITAQTLGITVTATDTSGLSASETFNATVQAVAASPPVLAKQTPNQSWTDGKSISFVLPSGTFTDPQGETLTYTESEISGPSIASWLTFNGTTGTFTGIAPRTGSGTADIQIVATDTSNLSASETFSVSWAAAGHGTAHGISVVSTGGLVAFPS